jgi:hypothetical protein
MQINMTKKSPNFENAAQGYEVVSDEAITEIPNWNTQLATLLGTAWTGGDNISYPPYPDLTDSDYWEQQVLPRWKDGSMHSWAAVRDGNTLSHAAIVAHDDKDERYFEIGRLAAAPAAPRGTTTKLFLAGTAFIAEAGVYGFLEGTVSHSRSQYMAREKAGWAFGGYVYRGFVAGKHLDGVLLDNASGDFTPEPGIVGRLHGELVPNSETHRERFQAIAGRVTCARTVEIAPFGPIHTLPDLVTPLNTIIEQNKDL